MALPKVPIKAPARKPMPRGRLLDIISRFELDPVNNGDQTVAARWINGVTWQPEPCRGLFTADVDACAEIDFIQIAPICEAAITQTPFAVYDALKGSALEYTADDLLAIIEGRVTLKTSAAFASELLSGAASGDRALRKSAHAPSIAFGAAATPIYNAIAVLEADLASTMRGARGMIHMPPGMLQEAVRISELELNADGQYETPLGNLVVADAGYLNAPQPTGGGGASTAGNDWIYASGPVEYQWSSPIAIDAGNIGSTITSFTSRETAALSVFTSRDDITRFVEAVGILIFDPCPVTAVLTSYGENA